MNPGASVLGVLGLCRVPHATLHTFRPVNPGPAGGCVRCVRFARPRARMRKIFFFLFNRGVYFQGGEILLRELLKTQHTLHTLHRKLRGIDFKRVFLCWVCVGLMVFVLGWVLVGENGHD